MKYMTAALCLLAASPVFSQERFVVGYFNEWPLPAHYGRQTGAYDQALGFPVEWIAFSDSQSLVTAVADGQAQIGLSVGLTPLIAGVLQRKSVQIIDIAVAYPETENCVTRPRLNISADNPTGLQDIVIAVPLGTSVHFNLLKQVEALGLDPNRLDLVNMSPREATAAFVNNKVDAACAWGAALETLTAQGSLLLNDDALETAGVRIFDAIISEDFYAQANQNKIVSFLRVINDINDDFATYPDPILPYLPALVNLSGDDSSSLLNLFAFPSLDEKLSDHWMTGGVQLYLNDLAEFYVAQATIDNVPTGLDRLVNPRYLQSLQDTLLAETLPPQQQENDPESGQSDSDAFAE